MNVNIPQTPHLYATTKINVTTSSDDAMQWTLTSPPPYPDLFATTKINVTTSSDDAMQWTLTSPHLYASILQRETHGSCVLRGTSSLAPINTSICHINVYMYISLSLSLHCLQINDLAWFARLGLGLVDVVQGIFLIIYSFKKLAEAWWVRLSCAVFGRSCGPGRLSSGARWRCPI